MLLGGWIEPMHVFVLVEDASVFVVCVGGTCLPWLLSILLNRVLFVLALIIVMMVVAPMPRAVVSHLVPLLSCIIFLFDPHVRGLSDC